MAHFSRGRNPSRLLRSRGQLLAQTLPRTRNRGASDPARARKTPHPARANRPGSRAPRRTGKPPAHQHGPRRTRKRVRQGVFYAHSQAVSKKNGGRFKRLRRQVKRKPNPDIAQFKRECLAELEQLSEQGHIDLFYGDESRVSLLPCVPYAWQFADEQVVMPSERGGGINCFALLSRDNRIHRHLTEEKINAAWISEKLDALSLTLARLTVVVLDNASVHAKAFKERASVWQARGLFVFFLPPYSPHLNIAETLWRKLKYEWLRPEDYADKETLHLAVWQALSAVGQALKINFQSCRLVPLSVAAGTSDLV